MPATIVYGLVGAIGVGDISVLLEARATGAIDFAAEDGLEERLGFGRLELLPQFAQLGFVLCTTLLLLLKSLDLLLEVLALAKQGAVLLIDVVKELLDAEHSTVVREGNAWHAVGHSFVDKAFDRGLAVKEGEL